MESVTNSPQARRAAHIERLHPIEYPAKLPVVAKREELAAAIAKNQVVIVCGETGSCFFRETTLETVEFCYTAHIEDGWRLP